jgi:hypothetical protein
VKATLNAQLNQMAFVEFLKHASIALEQLLIIVQLVINALSVTIIQIAQLNQMEYVISSTNVNIVLLENIIVYPMLAV